MTEQLSNGLSNELIARLDQLSTKLGQTGAAVWGFYVREQLVEGIITGGVSLLALLVAFALFHNKKKIDDWDEFGGFIFGRLFPMIFLVICVICAANMIQCLVNPQYWAFTDLIKTFVPKER